MHPSRDGGPFSGSRRRGGGQSVYPAPWTKQAQGLYPPRTAKARALYKAPPPAAVASEPESLLEQIERVAAEAALKVGFLREEAVDG